MGMESQKLGPMPNPFIVAAVLRSVDRFNSKKPTL